MARSVLVISPHPDDESIGCGGILRRHVLDGDKVHVVFLTSGEKGGHGRAPAETIEIRQQEAREAAKILEIEHIEFWHEPDGNVQVTPELVNRLNEKLQALRPAVLYVPHPNEMHADHVAAAELVCQAKSQLPRSVPKPDVLMFEIWTPLQVMDHIEDITQYIHTKIAAIRSYKCQNDVVGFDDAFLGLARYRGEMFCWPEGDYAEVFQRMR
jgi:N-acetylglucosamine malate deacetylase 1